jgi:sulfatase modifying factor 1
MGSDSAASYPGHGESPVHDASVGAFWIDACAVTNDQFREFVRATGHATPAEEIGWSYVFAGLLPDDFEPTRGVAHAPWWRQVFGACWATPEGSHSDLDARGDHPVLHVDWTDALAFATWAGKRLPTETEWESAARGGLDQCDYPWGDELTPDEQHRCNIWQGTFPTDNQCEDGYYGTAPVGAYPPNAHGLYSTTGNTWEWCSDWFSVSARRAGAVREPAGPATGTHKVLKGGSYLCHASYCLRYRVAARTASTPNSATGHMGFRCARDANGDAKEADPRGGV